MRNLLKVLLLLSLCHSTFAQDSVIYEVMAHDSYERISSFWSINYPELKAIPELVSDREISNESKEEDSFFRVKRMIYNLFFKYNVALYFPNIRTVFFNENRVHKYSDKTDDDLVIEVILAHEFGHHLLHEINEWPLDYETPDEDRIKIELQADCLSGVYIAQNGFVEEEVDLLSDFYSSIGGKVHGTGEQRKESFLKGIQAIDYKECL